MASAFPQLEILERIGRGGMGVVYRARQKSLDRWVALKLLAPGRERDPAFAERFAREARALAALNHANIVTVHDFGFAASPAAGEAGGFYFLLMEFVDGVNLRQALQAGRFTPEQALAIVPPVCTALQFAHERGIVHRDIKPENLLLDKDGRIKIADFGIAKMLSGEIAPAATPSTPHPAASPPAPSAGASPTAHTVAGTPQYMAPEQLDPAARADHRADIYSLGVVLYELLTGEPPGPRLEPPSTKVQIDVRLDRIVLRALAVQPELRYATAAEFRTQLDTVALTAPPPEPAAPPPATPPALLKTSSGVIHSPAELRTFAGQFCIWRWRGHLRLDEHRLTCTRGEVETVIPLASIRDVSLARYPLSMNPAGVDVLSVTYEDAHQPQQVFLAPMHGWFAWPSTWNARIQEWHDLIRNAVARAAGRAPGSTPRDRVGVPPSNPGVVGLLAGVLLVYGLGLALALTTVRSRSFGGGALAMGVFVAGGLAGLALLQSVFWRRGRPADTPVSPSPWTRVLGALLVLISVGLGSGLLARHRAQMHARATAFQVMHQAAETRRAALSLQIEDLAKRLSAAPEGTERTRLEQDRDGLESTLQEVKAESASLERTLAVGPPRLRFFVFAPAVPLLLGGLGLLVRPGAARSVETRGRGWMFWLGVSALGMGLPVAALGTWMAIQVAQDSSWNPGPAEAITAVVVWGSSVGLLLGGLSLLALARPRAGRGGWGTAIVVTGFAVAFSAALGLGAGSLPFTERFDRVIGRPASRLANLEMEPVRLSDNVIVLNLRATVINGPIELRIGLRGSPLTTEELERLPGRLRGLPRALARSGLPSGNAATSSLLSGAHVWQVGFVFPHDAAAAETFRGLSSRSLGDVAPGDPVELFHTIASDGVAYVGQLDVRPPTLTSGSSWIQLTGTSAHNESFVRLSWEVSVGSDATLHAMLGRRTFTFPLRPAKTWEPPSGANVGRIVVELNRLGTERVGVRITTPARTETQEWSGDFESIAGSLLGSACFSARGTRGAEFELCRLNGEPFTLLQLADPIPIPGAQPSGPSAPTPIWALGVSRGLGAVAVLGFLLVGMVGLGVVAFLAFLAFRRR